MSWWWWWWWGGYHWWWPGLVLMGAFMVICGAFMIRTMHGGMGGMCGSGWRRSGRHATDAPEQLLYERLARGEIGISEYRRIHKALADSSSPADSEQAGDQQ